MATEYLNNKNFEKIIIKFQQVKRNKTQTEWFVDDIKQTEQRTAKRNKFIRPDAWDGVESDLVQINTNFILCQNELTTAFYLLSENIAKYARFPLLDPDDAIQEGVVICFDKIDRFNPKRGKAFNFFTTVVIHLLRQLYRTSKNYNELKKRFYNDNSDNPLL